MGARRIVKKTPIKVAQRPGWLSRRLIGALVLVGMVGGGLSLAAWRLAQPETLPIQTVQVEGEFRYLAREDLYKAIGSLASGGFFNVDVRAVKQAVEAMAWIDRASVRRIWPDTLRIEIVEQTPLALWAENKEGGKSKVVNARGELFHPPTKGLPTELPFFVGPEGTEEIVAKRYQQLSGMFVKAGLDIAGLTLSDRRAWQVTTKNGLQIVLGRTTGDEQLRRFTSAYAEVIANKVQNIRAIDLRYTNGFSVRWKTLAPITG
jgi:cell division protein FtsQ